MKHNLIKYKITLWYTSLLAILAAVTLTGVIYFSEYYIIEKTKAELSDEVSDFCQGLTRSQDISSQLMGVRYYDDGVVLSIYDEQEKILDGLYPSGFPIKTRFEEGDVRKLRQGSDHWVFLDQMIRVDDDTYWIRGIYTLNLLDGMKKKAFQLWGILLPFMIILIAYIGYRMIKHILDPIYNITKMADDIAKSNNLSLRLPEPTTKDELAYLTQTFNYMLTHLEEMFCREKQFTSDAAHELRTPISVISSHCEYCLEELPSSEEIKKELMIIHKKASSMSELVGQLLMIARAESGTYRPNFEEADLEILVDSVVDELKGTADKHHIQLHVDNLMTQPVIRCDVYLIVQVLLNLIGNAINYGREDGKVEVIIENEQKGCVIHVRDDGIGIPPDEIEKIWDRFYRIDASRSEVKGFGLGLFMVRWMVEMHHGSVGVKSVPGLGSVFTVHLPGEGEV